MVRLSMKSSSSVDIRDNNWSREIEQNFVRPLWVPLCYQLDALQTQPIDEANREALRGNDEL